MNLMNPAKKPSNHGTGLLSLLRVLPLAQPTDDQESHHDHHQTKEDVLKCFHFGQHGIETAMEKKSQGDVKRRKQHETHQIVFQEPGQRYLQYTGQNRTPESHPGYKTQEQHGNGKITLQPKSCFLQKGMIHPLPDLFRPLIAQPDEKEVNKVDADKSGQGYQPSPNRVECSFRAKKPDTQETDLMRNRSDLVQRDEVEKYAEIAQDKGIV